MSIGFRIVKVVRCATLPLRPVEGPRSMSVISAFLGIARVDLAERSPLISSYGPAVPKTCPFANGARDVMVIVVTWASARSGQSADRHDDDAIPRPANAEHDSTTTPPWMQAE
mgnify:CR=1 FL=1